MRAFLPIPLLALGCSAAAQPVADSWPSIETAPPMYGTLGPPPRDDRPQGEASWYARSYGVSVAEGQRRMRLQEELADEIGSLRQRLAAEMPDNFADVWIEHVPEWRVVFAFKRDGEAILRQHTNNPNFTAREVRYSLAELEAARADITAQLQAAGIGAGIGTDVADNVVGVDLNIDRAELDALIAAGRLRPSPLVRLSAPAPFAGEAMTPEAARLVRFFPQARQRTGMETSELNVGTIVLRNGCLRLDRPGDDDPLAFFGAESALKVDEAGHLAVYRRDGDLAGRIGEPLVLGGGAGRPVTNEPALEPLRAACGDGPAVWVGNPHSHWQFRLRWSGWQVDQLAERERISRDEAFARMRACWLRQDEAAERARLRGEPPRHLGPPCELAPPPRPPRPVEG
jgi:hypothetical protein